MVMGVATEERISHAQSGTTFELYYSSFEANGWSSCNFAPVVEDFVFDQCLHNLSRAFIENMRNVGNRHSVVDEQVTDGQRSLGPWV